MNIITLKCSVDSVESADNWYIICVLRCIVYLSVCFEFKPLAVMHGRSIDYTLIHHRIGDRIDLTSKHLHRATFCMKIYVKYPLNQQNLLWSFEKFTNSPFNGTSFVLFYNFSIFIHERFYIENIMLIFNLKFLRYFTKFTFYSMKDMFSNWINLTNMQKYGKFLSNLLS